MSSLLTWMAVMSHIELLDEKAFLKGVSQVSSFCLHIPGLMSMDPPRVRCGTMRDSHSGAAVPVSSAYTV